MSSRYTIVGTLASGGMGTVYLARMVGSAGFSRLVAIKRLHPELAAQREFIAMLVDEARLASQVRHVNVIDTLDLVASDGAFSVVLEYVEGPSLSGLIRAQLKHEGTPVPMPIALSIVSGLLRGLDAAHEARGTEGQPLGIVHRDISPQNVLVGVDGIARIIDFGIAKAMGRVATTRPGEVRGKFAYMAPEQLLERPATRQVDVYAAGVVLWELLTGDRMFKAEDQRAIAAAVMRGDIKAPSSVNPAIPPELDKVVLNATARELSDRYLTAREFLDALAPFPRASEDEVGQWVRERAAEFLAKRSAMLQNVISDRSRSVEDLMEELRGTETPPSTRVPVDGPFARPPTPAAPLSQPMLVPPPPPVPYPSSARMPMGPPPPGYVPTLPVQEMPSMLSTPGYSSPVIEIPGVVPARGQSALRYLVAACGFFGVLLVAGLLFAFRRHPAPPPPHFDTEPSAAAAATTPSAPVEIPPPPSAVVTAVPPATVTATATATPTETAAPTASVRKPPVVKPARIPKRDPTDHP